MTIGDVTLNLSLIFIFFFLDIPSPSHCSLSVSSLSRSTLSVFTLPPLRLTLSDLLPSFMSDPFLFISLLWTLFSPWTLSLHCVYLCFISPGVSLSHFSLLWLSFCFALPKTSHNPQGKPLTCSNCWGHRL